MNILKSEKGEKRMKSDQIINNNNNNNNNNNVFMSNEKYISSKEKEINLQFFEDTGFNKNQKRAFTLGAIDNIGDIVSLLKAPLINPKESPLEPPVLQLPVATNLIKNIHLKTEQEKDIDKLYKYRMQNSNRDMLMNMKPLYSLPEKVMTYYYMGQETEKKRKQKEEEKEGDNEEEKEEDKEEEKEEDKEEEKEEEKEEDKEEDKEVEKENEEGIKILERSGIVKEEEKEQINYSYRNKSSVQKIECTDKEKLFVSNKKHAVLKKNYDLENVKEKKIKEKVTDKHKEESNKQVNIELEQKQMKIGEMKKEMKNITERELFKINPNNIFRPEYIGPNKKINKGSEKTDENDILQSLKGNPFMSSTLTNALRFLAGDIC